MVRLYWFFNYIGLRSWVLSFACRYSYRYPYRLSLPIIYPHIRITDMNMPLHAAQMQNSCLAISKEKQKKKSAAHDSAANTQKVREGSQGCSRIG